MPYMKIIKGHREAKFLGKYLTKNGRAKAVDCFNLVEKDSQGHAWWEQMDETRHVFENDIAPKNKQTRTYEHIIISLDEHDQVTLEEFRDYINDFITIWFSEDESRIGRYEVAAVYHDDNKERTSKGSKGILHAHIVVNNTELNDGSRLSPRMKTELVRQMRKELNERAHRKHWYCFAENDKSMSYDDMVAQGLKPKSKGWGKQSLDSLPDLLEAELQSENNNSLKSIEHSLDPKLPCAKPVSKYEEAQMFITLTDRDGAKIQVPIDKKYTRESFEERKAISNKGYSWKGELRDRIYFALQLADTPQQFASILNDFGVTITQAKNGDIMFHHPDGGAKRCKGATLGKGYTANDLYKEFANKGWRRDEYANRYTGYIPIEMRLSIKSRISGYKTGTREGTEKMAGMKHLIGYVLKNRITNLDDFGQDTLAMAAKAAAQKMNLFEFNELKHKPVGEMTVRERLAWKYRNDTVTPTPHKTNLSGSSFSVGPEYRQSQGQARDSQSGQSR